MTNSDLNKIVRITAEAFSASFDQQWVTRAQEKKSPSRNAMFGILMNEPFIPSTDKSKGVPWLDADGNQVKQNGKLMYLHSLVDTYGDSDAADIVSLVIYNLANPSGYVKPTVARI